MTLKIYRQGDILLREIDPWKIPKGAKKRRTNIILEGEATGHAHQIVNGVIYEVFDTETPQMFIEAKSKSSVIHDEHAPIELSSGWYEVIRQREYDPSLEHQTRVVVD